MDNREILKELWTSLQEIHVGVYLKADNDLLFQFIPSWTFWCSVSILYMMLSSCMFGVSNATQYLIAHRILDKRWEETADFSANVWILNIKFEWVFDWNWISGSWNVSAGYHFSVRERLSLYKQNILSTAFQQNICFPISSIWVKISLVEKSI